MYLLRTIVNDKEGVYISDNWYMIDSEEELIDKVNKIDPSEYQCFDSRDITDFIHIRAEEVAFEKERSKKRKIYEELKKEFENEEA
jgi:hypothetical protein